MIHTPHVTARYAASVDLLDLRLPGALRAADEQSDAEFETAKVDGRTGATVRTDRPRRPPRRWSSTRSAGAASSPAAATSRPKRHCRAGSRSTPGSGDDLEIWIDRATSGRLRLELPGPRRAADRRRLVRSPLPRQGPTVRLAEDLDRDAVRYQGNWIPHKLRDAAEDGVFFVGDSAGHCLPLTAEGIRTAFYFGIACGRELRAVRRGQRHARDGAAPLRRLLGRARWKFESMLRAQRLVPRVPPRLLAPALRGMAAARSSTGRSGTTCGSRRPSSSRGRPRRGAAAAAAAWRQSALTAASGYPPAAHAAPTERDR